MPDGSLVTVESDDEESWEKSRLGMRPTVILKKANMQPVEILFDEESLVIENQEEMRSAFKNATLSVMRVESRWR